MLKYKIRDHFPSIEHAFMASLGQTHLESLRTQLRKRPSDGVGECVVLDLSGIEVCTASYLKATIIWLMRSGQLSAQGKEATTSEDIRQWRPIPLEIFPVVCGLEIDVQLELDDLLRLLNLPCLEALEIVDGDIRLARLYGSLEANLEKTLQLLTQEGTATAAQLWRAYNSENITVNGWNNRLSDLYQLRLVRRTKLGRQWVYEPVAMEICHG